MRIISTTVLSENQKNQIIDLIRICHRHDNTYSDIYLSNEFNFDKDMPAFFLAYIGEKLVGFLSNYADEVDDVEISLIVHPEYRRRGIAKQLIKVFEKETKGYNLKQIYYHTEDNFINSNPSLMIELGLEKDQDGDVLLGRNREKFTIELNPLWEVKKATLEDVEAIAAFQSKSFDMPLEVAIRYAKEPIEGEGKDIFILKEEGIVISSCTIDYSYSSNFIYGFATIEEKRGKGAGSYLLKTVLNDLIDENEEDFQIMVEEKNFGAFRLYEKLGFKKLAKIIYLKAKSNN